jgi:hypothetical protein
MQNNDYGLPIRVRDIFSPKAIGFGRLHPANGQQNNPANPVNPVQKN